MLFDRHAFTPQITPSSGSAITVTNICSDADQPITRIVRPDSDARVGVDDQPVRVGERLVGPLGLHLVLGDVVAPVAPVQFVLHTPTVLHVYYGRKVLVGQETLAFRAISDRCLAISRSRSAAACW